MANVKNPVSRPILLFSMMVAISGILLTSVSISNISNLRILKERRIRMEQLDIASFVSARFQKTIENKADEFSRLWLDSRTAIPAGFYAQVCQDSLIRPFVFDPGRGFIYPRYAYFESKYPPATENTLPGFSEGERIEFREGDIPRAFKYYYSLLSYSISPALTAKIYNALARVSVNMNHPDQALLFDKKILTEFPDALNENGFPYSYFSVGRLMKLSPGVKSGEIPELLRNFILDLANGKIPLNPGTTDLMTDLTMWLRSFSAGSKSVVDSTASLIEQIFFRLKFISEYGDLIKEYVADRKRPEYFQYLGKYKVIPSSSNGKNTLLLIDDHRAFPSGFLVEVNELWNKVKTDNPVLTYMQYDVELWPVDSALKSPHKDLIYHADLSPFLLDQRIVIRPLNAGVVREFVRSRSWRYGILLVLLIGAMSLGILLIIRDFQREKKLAEMQSEFVSNVTHELKTPLTSIRMFAETIFLDRAKTVGDRKRYAHIIMKESEVLKRKIDNILKFAVLKNESSRYKFRETDLIRVVGEALDEMKYWLDINEFEVETDLDERIIAFVDEEAIKQALTNLIGNAIKYSPSEKRLMIRCRKTGGEIRMEVEDSGMGIPEGQAGMIFEKFYRVHSPENESTSGTGLGLSVTRDIVRAHNGEISVESRPGHGSKFIIVLKA